jgi:TonB family protein
MRLSLLLALALLQMNDLNEALRKEIREGNYAVAEKLLENPDVDPDSRDGQSWTALMYAARAEQPELITLLLKAGAALNLVNDDGESALIVAVKRRNVGGARRLLMAGADTSLRDSRGKTALDWAEEENRTYLAQIIRIASRPNRARVTVAEKPVQLGSESLAPPRVLRETPPLYTERAFDRGVEGRVVLKVIVRKDGSIGPVRIHRSLDPDLDEAAAEAVRTWVFEPARADGEPVNVLIDVEVDFLIQRKKS